MWGYRTGPWIFKEHLQNNSVHGSTMDVSNNDTTIEIANNQTSN